MRITFLWYLCPLRMSYGVKFANMKQSIETLITTSKGNLDTVYPALLTILTNIAPHIKHISPSASSKVVQLFSAMSAPSFLLANETNHTLLASLLDFINAILEHGFTGGFLNLSCNYCTSAPKTDQPLRKPISCVCNPEA